MHDNSVIIQPHPVLQELKFPTVNTQVASFSNDICEEIVRKIEDVRDKDKNVGDYPYNKCIDIVKEVMKEDDRSED